MKRTYVYANPGAPGEILAQHNGPAMSADANFYMHDRLGSVREVINKAGSVVKYYSFDPFGKQLEGGPPAAYPFMFTGQYYDYEIAQYYLRARQYDPQLMRLTARDLLLGNPNQSLSLHRYLYCLNSPVNMTDLSGRSAWSIFGALSAGIAVHSAAIYAIATGLSFDNDDLVNMGFQMEHFVAPAMYLGAILGPYIPSAAGAITSAALTTWEGLTAVAGYTAGATLTGVRVGAQAVSYLAIVHPYEFVSIIDVLAQVGGPPDGIPVTPAGFVAWLYMNWHRD